MVGLVSNKESSSHGKVPPVAVDTAGSDKGVSVIVEGAVQALKQLGVESVLVGPEAQVRDSLRGLGADGLGLRVVDAPEIIEMHESPSRAVRRKTKSSLLVAYDLVKAGEASSVISAGNSGAMMVAGTLRCGLIAGVERPAIAALIPVAGARSTVILDSGANVDCHAHNLVQFAVMGSVYSNSLYGLEKPKVALLSNGAESTKGNDVIRAAATELQTLKGINFVGYVEGGDVTTSAADVVVCDGFVGNLVIKAMEGCVRLMVEQMKIEGAKSLKNRLGLFFAKGILRQVFHEKLDYTAQGGAPLLGLRKLALVLHGSSDSRAVLSAVRLAHSFAVSRMTDKIAEQLGQLEELFDVQGGLYCNVVPRAAGGDVS